MRKISILHIVLACLAFKVVYAQDMQFTQMYTLPMYINPAYTGNTESHRAALKYRNQWPGVNKAFTSMAVAYDYNDLKRNSGFGLMCLRNNAGLNALRTTNVRFLYAYTLKFKENHFLKMGVNMDYTRKEINLSQLVFNDQLFTQSSTSYDQVYADSKNYFDAGTGAIYSYNHFWGGVSINHLNRPSISTIDRKARLPMYLHINTGVRLVNKRVYETYLRYWMLYLSYRQQAKFKQLDFGVNYVINNLTLGLMYRGIPMRKEKFLDRNDALAFTLGFNIPKYNLRFGYSYDLTISRLAINSFGSHELSLVFEFQSKNRINNKFSKIVSPEY